MRTNVCGEDWYTGRKPGARPNLVPSFFGFFTPVESNRPKEWCKWSERPRRADARILGGKQPSFGSGDPTMNSPETDIWGIGKGTPGNFEKTSTMEGSVNLPVQHQESNYIPSISIINQLTHSPDTRLQHAPLRFYK